MSDVETDHLGTFLRFADAVQANAENARRPAYAEVCPCGGSVETSRDVPAAERRRIREAFAYRHRDCATPHRRATPAGTDSADGAESER